MKGGQFLVEASQPDQVFRPEDFSDEHGMIARTAEEFIDGEVLPQMEAIDRPEMERVVEALKKAGELGLLGHSVPERYGGLGLDKVTKGIVGEKIGKVGSYAVAHANHTCIATLPVTYFGTPELKAKYLPKMASGEYLGAYCLTEPTAGSDAMGAKTTARLNEEGTHYILNGTKQFITNAGFADTFIVYAKVDGTKFTAFLVEQGTPGLTLGAEEEKMGIKGSSTRQVFFEDCPVPVENVLGEVGRGHVIAFNVLNLGRFNLGGVAMGAAKHALAVTVDYVKERHQFGRPLADFPMTKDKLAGIAARIYAAESLQYRTAQLLEEALGDLYEQEDPRRAAKQLAEYALECSICKVFGSETLDLVVDEGVQLHGGYGYIREYPIERMYRDSRINRIFEGTNEINRLLIPTTLLRKAKKGELDLAAAVKDAAAGGPQPIGDGPLAQEREATDLIRGTFLSILGSALETLDPDHLAEEQEIMVQLAELAILLFAAESAVLRTTKAVEEKGTAAVGLQRDLTAVYLEEALLHAEQTARKLIRELLPSEQSYQQEEALCRAFVRYRSEGNIPRRRRIADRLLEAGGYTASGPSPIGSTVG